MRRRASTDLSDFAEARKTRVPASAAEARRQPEQKELYYCTNTLEETCLTSTQMKAQNLNPNDYPFYRSEQECKNKCQFGEPALAALIVNYAGDPAVYEYPRFQRVPRGHQYTMNKEMEELLQRMQYTLSSLSGEELGYMGEPHFVREALFRLIPTLERVEQIWRSGEGFAKVWEVVRTLWTLMGYVSFADFDQRGGERHPVIKTIHTSLQIVVDQRFPLNAWMETFLRFLQYHPKEIYQIACDWFIGIFERQYDKFGDVAENKIRYRKQVYELFGVTSLLEGINQSDYFEVWIYAIRNMRRDLFRWSGRQDTKAINEAADKWTTVMNNIANVRYVNFRRAFYDTIMRWEELIMKYLPIGICLLIWEIAFTKNFPFNFAAAVGGLIRNPHWGMTPEADEQLLLMIEKSVSPFVGTEAPTDAYIASELMGLQTKQYPKPAIVLEQYRSAMGEGAHHLFRELINHVQSMKAKKEKALLTRKQEAEIEEKQRLAEEMARNPIVTKAEEPSVVRETRYEQLRRIPGLSIEQMRSRRRDQEQKARALREQELNSQAPASAAAAAGIVVDQVANTANVVGELASEAQNIVRRPAAAAAAAANDLLYNTTKTGGQSAINIVRELF